MRWLLPVLALLLSGCGFYLQGSLPSGAVLPVFTVSGLADTHPLVQELEQQSANYRQDAQQTRRLHISRAQWQQRVISHAQDGTPVEYELRLELRVQVQDQDGQLRAEYPLSVYGDYSFSPALILSKGVEEARLRDDLVQRAATNILRRLAYQQ
ncbi:MAG: LPS assembly lipoprotein LptE [Gammaproteobacteria bacterium]|nr:LPS assembly lipoprotein LptE [Gammaproteobacteria bacterium]